MQQETYTRFLVNHPDLLSDFLSPKDIPCAKLLKVTCNVCYGSRPRKKCIKKPNKRRKIEEPERTRVQAPYGLRHKPKPSKQASERDADEEEEENDDADEDERNKDAKTQIYFTQPQGGTRNSGCHPTATERKERTWRRRTRCGCRIDDQSSAHQATGNQEDDSGCACRHRPTRSVSDRHSTGGLQYSLPSGTWSISISSLRLLTRP